MTDAITSDLTGLSPLHPVLPHVVVYTQPICPECDKLKMLLALRKIPAATVDITQTPEALEMFSDQMGVRTTPIALVHNLYTEPVYFLRADVERLRTLSADMNTRLATLDASGDLGAITTEAIRDELKNSVDRNTRVPAAALFAELTARLVPVTAVSTQAQELRINQPALLDTTDDAQELLG